MSTTRLHVVPLELAEANRLVKQWHRHHYPSVGHRWAKSLNSRPDVIAPSKDATEAVDALFGEEVQP